MLQARPTGLLAMVTGLINDIIAPASLGATLQIADRVYPHDVHIWNASGPFSSITPLVTMDNGDGIIPIRRSLRFLRQTTTTIRSSSL
ncbi:hypothetical protein BD779DRAFT_1208032 [Infundibulicybe gibba]|nr:hypothetical protein BD779DRAFT_1208032 [Infundibulicybe gibba]